MDSKSEQYPSPVDSQARYNQSRHGQEGGQSGPVERACGLFFFFAVFLRLLAERTTFPSSFRVGQIHGDRPSSHFVMLRSLLRPRLSVLPSTLPSLQPTLRAASTSPSDDGTISTTSSIPDETPDSMIPEDGESPPSWTGRQELSFNDRLKLQRPVPYRVQVTCSSNNTHLVLSALPHADGGKDNAEIVAWTTAGSVGFKKAQRSGFEAATQAALRMWEIVEDLRQGKLKAGKSRRYVRENPPPLELCLMKSFLTIELGTAHHRANWRFASRATDAGARPSSDHC
jgi:hypothetical protein